MVFDVIYATLITASSYSDLPRKNQPESLEARQEYVVGPDELDLDSLIDKIGEEEEPFRHRVYPPIRHQWKRPSLVRKGIGIR